MDRTEAQINRDFFWFCDSKLTLEENDRMDHTKQQAHTQQTKKRE